MREYTEGKIYKLVNGKDRKIYIGSTINALCVRIAIHKMTAKTSKSKLYSLMNEIGKNEFKIELIEKYPCKNRDELREREEYWRKKLIEEGNEVLNERMCYLSSEEKKEKELKQSKDYYEKNKEARKAYYKMNCALRKEYQRNYYKYMKNKCI